MASALFKPLTIKSVTFKNRIAVSPMCQYSSVDGFANDWHLVHLGSRAVGGAALVIAEATAVNPEGRISPQDLGIWKDEHIEKLKQITDFISGQNCIPGIQLAHAGRKASTYPAWKGRGQVPPDQGGWEPVSASTIPFHEKETKPAELDQDGISIIVDDFKNAALRAFQAGFKVIEIHAAHGYLIHQFLSPLSNVRTDQYGGSFENRIRFLIEIMEAIQTVWPADLPVFVRISATDWADHGWDAEQSVALAKILKTKGADLIDVSSGGLAAHQKITVGPLYQVPFSEKVKSEAGILTGAVGLITTPQEAEGIVANGKADLVLLAREMLRNPYFPINAAQNLGEDIDWPVQYDRAKPPRSV